MGASDDELDGRQSARRRPDRCDDRRRPRLGDARPERVVDDPVAVDANGDRREHRRRDADGLEEQDDGAHRRREHPVSVRLRTPSVREHPVPEHGHRERERHTERGHNEVGDGQVNQEPAEVCA